MNTLKSLFFSSLMLIACNQNNTPKPDETTSKNDSLASVIPLKTDTVISESKPTELKCGKETGHIMGDDGAVQTCQINTTDFAVAYEFLLKDKISEDPDTYALIPKKLPQQSEEKEMNDLPNTDFFYYKFIYSGTDKLDISYEWSGGGKDFELRKTKNHIKIKIMHWAQ